VFNARDPLADEFDMISPNVYALGDPVNIADPDELCPHCILGAVWAAYEIGSSICDGANAARTALDPEASLGEKFARDSRRFRLACRVGATAP